MSRPSLHLYLPFPTYSQLLSSSSLFLSSCHPARAGNAMGDPQVILLLPRLARSTSDLLGLPCTSRTTSTWRWKAWLGFTFWYLRMPMLVRCRLAVPHFAFQHWLLWFASLRGLRALSPGQEQLSGF